MVNDSRSRSCSRFMVTQALVGGRKQLERPEVKVSRRKIKDTGETVLRGRSESLRTAGSIALAGRWSTFSQPAKPVQDVNKPS